MMNEVDVLVNGLLPECLHLNVNENGAVVLDCHEHANIYGWTPPVPLVEVARMAAHHLVVRHRNMDDWAAPGVHSRPQQHEDSRSTS